MPRRCTSHTSTSRRGGNKKCISSCHQHFNRSLSSHLTSSLRGSYESITLHLSPNIHTDSPYGGMETNGGNSRSWRCVLYLRPALCGVFLGRTNSFLTGDGGNSLSFSSVSTSTTSTLLGSPLSSPLLANIFISYLLRPYTRLYFLNSPYRNGICLSTMMNGGSFLCCRCSRNAIYLFQLGL